MILFVFRRGAWSAGRSGIGPEFLAITSDRASVTVECSPVQFIRLVGPASRGARVGSFDGQQFDGATFEIPSDWSYAYVEIEDECGRRAWTNTLFVHSERA